MSITWKRQFTAARKYHAFRKGDERSLCGRHRLDHPHGWHDTKIQANEENGPGFWLCLTCYRKAMKEQ